VVNNVNQEAFVFRNNARTQLDNRYLQIRLEGEGANRYGVGAKVTLRSGEQLFFQELMPSRGFQSSVDYALTFGVGRLDTIRVVTVEWPDGRVSVERDVPTNQSLTVRQSAAVTRAPAETASPAPIFTDVTAEIGLDFVHRENDFVDFHREPLMPKLLSTEGPFMAVGDVNGDGLDDAFIGGAKEQAGRLLLQRSDGTLAESNQTLLERDRISEDLGAAFFDAEGDGDLDLYVVSGGSEFSDHAPGLRDRLYLNDGRGRFRKAEGSLPEMSQSGSRVAAHDFDGDGDIDLFVGGRVVPWRYGFDPPSVLLANDGQGRFTDVTQQAAPDLANIGMVTDAIWEDVDGDNRADLVVVGEWMPITIFRNAGNGRLERADVPGLERSHGWWNRIAAGDFTGDGRTDFVLGNLGLNTRLRATEREPLTLYVKDFDRNGSVEQILSQYNDGVSYPFALRDDLLSALPYLRDRYPSYEDYALQTVADVFSEAELADAVVKRAYTFETALARNDGDGSFTLLPLPVEAQIAPTYGILPADIDEDGHLDLLLAGNFDGVKPEIGRMSAGHGLVLLGDGTGGFEPVPGLESGFLVPGQARDIQRIRTVRDEPYIARSATSLSTLMDSMSYGEIPTRAPPGPGLIAMPSMTYNGSLSPRSDVWPRMRTTRPLAVCRTSTPVTRPSRILSIGWPGACAMSSAVTTDGSRGRVSSQESASGSSGSAVSASGASGLAASGAGTPGLAASPGSPPFVSLLEAQPCRKPRRRPNTRVLRANRAGEDIGHLGDGKSLGVASELSVARGSRTPSWDESVHRRGEAESE
ncbi:MAG: FG-GAP-like repeat-containing protein, partial [Gemmatimonadales bacterium]